MRTRPDDLMAEMKMSLPMTSSFFWSSPVEFAEPARPERLISEARRMYKSYVKSPVASLCFVCSSVRNLVRVMISVLMASEPPGPVCDSLFEGIL
ncbi:hypothetical protein KCU87_g395, partial [Aureobasidium melanogenum]